MNISKLSFFRYDLPLTIPLLLGGSPVRTRSGWLVRIEDESGKAGWGEAAPLPGFSRETLESTRTELRWLQEHTDRIKWPGVRLDHPDYDDEWLSALDLSPSTRFGLELAFCNLRTTVKSGKPSDIQVPISGLLLGTRDQILSRAAELKSSGYRSAKLKIGRQAVTADVVLVKEVKKILGDHIALRLDANRAWSLPEGLQFAKELGDCPVEYVEEPLAQVSEIKSFMDKTKMPVALDETLVEMSTNEWARWVGLSAVVLKPTLIGGISRAVRLARRAMESNIKPVISACFESGVGVAGLAPWAWQLTRDEVPAGLDTYQYLAGDVLIPRLNYSGGYLRISGYAVTDQEIDFKSIQEIS